MLLVVEIGFYFLNCASFDLPISSPEHGSLMNFCCCWLFSFREKPNVQKKNEGHYHGCGLVHFQVR